MMVGAPAAKVVPWKEMMIRICFLGNPKALLLDFATHRPGQIVEEIL